MIVRTLEDVSGTDGETHGHKWHSMRLLRAAEGLGVSLTDCILEEGFETTVWPDGPLQACYCLEGEGCIEDLATGRMHQIKPGTLYAQSTEGSCRLRASTRMRLICAGSAASRAARNAPGDR